MLFGSLVVFTLVTLSLTTDPEVERLLSEVTSLRQQLEVLQQKVSQLERKEDVPYQSCDSAPCLNGGTCVEVNVDVFICMCRDGYFGVTCEQTYADFSFLVTIDPVHIFPVDEEPAVFNYVVRHSDAYDNTTGIFTAPLDGDYEFMLHALCNNDTTIDIYMVVDGVMITRGHSHQYPVEEVDGDPVLDQVILLPLTAGQQVWITTTGVNDLYGAGDPFGMRTWWSDHLVHAV